MKTNKNKAEEQPLKKAETSRWFIYPFFLLHMLIFGLSGFLMSYATHNIPFPFIIIHGGIAIIIYTTFYVVFFGFDKVKWMFINAALGFMGIYSQLGLILSFFGKRISDYPGYIHAIPFLYYIFYTFLIRQALLDLTGAHKDADRKKKVEQIYIIGSIVIYVTTYLLT